LQEQNKVDFLPITDPLHPLIEERRPEIGNTFPVLTYFADNRTQKLGSYDHYHSYFEILFISQDSFHVTIDYEKHHLIKGDLVLIADGTVHSSLYRPEAATQMVVLQFMSSFIFNGLLDEIDSKYLTSIYNYIRLHKKLILHMGEEDNFFGILLDTIQEYQEKKTGYEVFIKANITRLFAIMIRYLFGDIEEFKSHILNYKKIKPVITYIEKEYMNDINMDKAANLTNLTYSYFSHIFQKITGYTFKDYLALVRIRKFEQLIITGNKSITDAAYQVGFGSISNFYRTYKKLRNNSPNHYLLEVEKRKS
jgi:AraC-like DNA-binding protein